ncbi:MAG: alpha-L-rhamnosidase N-terminal domain-containing protein [Verrucomicrobiota bacterium]
MGGPRTVPPAVYYRRVFQLGGPVPKRIFLHITALGLFECVVNGQRVGEDVLAPGWADYRLRVYYRSYDITALLQPGENVHGVILGDGWYSGHVAEKDRQFYGEQPALLGHHEEAARYEALYTKIVEAFRAPFITPDGLVVGGTQTGYVLALHFHLVPQELRATASRELVRLIARNGHRIGTGFVGPPYILHALEATGHLDMACKLLEQEAFPSWLFPVKNGATTIWERWDGWTPEKGFQDAGMNSFNHYAYGAVGDWMVSTVAGLQFDPAHPGYEHILFKPRPGGTLTWAEATLTTPHGKAAIRWELNDATLTLNLTVPAGARATLDLPAAFQTAPLTLAEGEHQRTFKK